MKKIRLVEALCLLIGIASSLISLGCGAGELSSSSATPSSIASTRNPLVAQYNVRPLPANSTAWVEFGEDTNYGRQTSPSEPTTNVFQTLSILVAGMKPSTTYHMRAHVDSPGGSWVEPDATFTTGPLPKVSAGTTTPLTLPGIKVALPTPGLTPAPGVELFNLVQPSNGNWLRAFVTDLQGNVIWYYDPGPKNGGDPVPMKPMQNGHFILNVGDLREIDLAGNIYRDISYQQVNQSLQANGYSFSIIAFHHDVLVLPNGHWIALCNTLKDFTNLPGYPGVTTVLGDALVDIDPSGNVVWAWSGFDHLDINRHPFGLAIMGAGADWTHSNAIVSSADGNLFLSMRNQCWVLKIDYENGAGTGDILWRLGYQGDFTLASGVSSDWFFGQHFPVPISDDGVHTTFAIEDNGDFRVMPDGTTCGTTVACYSRATIFQVDQEAKEASLEWQYLPGYYNFWGGSIEVLENGDVDYDMTTPFGSDSDSIILEVSQNPEQVVWQLDLDGENAYRGYRIPSLYPGVTWQQ